MRHHQPFITRMGLSCIAFITAQPTASSSIVTVTWNEISSIVSFCCCSSFYDCTMKNRPMTTTYSLSSVSFSGGSLLSRIRRRSSYSFYAASTSYGGQKKMVMSYVYRAVSIYFCDVFHVHCPMSRHSRSQQRCCRHHCPRQYPRPRRSLMSPPLASPYRLTF